MFVACTAAAANNSEYDNDQLDQIRSYARSATCYGLLDLCHRDTVREADGPAIMSMWRINMLRFWDGNHFKYLRAGHRLLAGMLLCCTWLMPMTRTQETCTGDFLHKNFSRKSASCSVIMVMIVWL